MLLSRTNPSIREVLNLRPAPGGLLKPVGAPLTLPLTNLTPFGALTVGSTRRLICASGSNLFSHPTTAAIGSPTPIPGNLPGAPDCAVALSDDRLLMMTAGGSAQVVASGGNVAIETPPQIAGISLTASAYGPLSTTVGGLTMSDKEPDYNLRLAAVESKLLALGKSAHAQLHLGATNDGRYTRPVVCGFRLRNHRGHEIFRSGPILLGDTSAETSVNLYSDDNLTIKPWQQSVNTWKIHLRVDPSAALSDTVGTLEVLAMPQLHSVHPDQGGYAVLTRHTSASLPFARLSLHAGESETYTRGQIAALAARLFDHGTVIYAVNDPFSSALSIDLNTAADPSFSVDARALSKVLRTSLPEPPTAIRASLALPHGFTAACGCRSGDTILWGNITPVAYSGYPPQMLASTLSTTSESWSYSMLVLLSDGRRIFSEGTSYSPRPTVLSPLITYPHPDATELQLRISSTAGVWRADLPLRPSPCGRFAYHLAEGLTPIAVTPNAGAPILSVGSAAGSVPHLIVAAHASAPTVAVAAIEMPDGPVRAIVERPGNDTAWDHTRSRFFIGTRGGVHAIGVYINADRPTHTLRRLSSSGISSRGALVPIDEGAAALLSVPQGALPVIITKNGTLKPLCDPFDAARVAYNPVAREVIAHGAGLTRFFCLDHDCGWYHRDDLSMPEMVQIDGMPYGLSTAGVYALAVEHPYGNTRPVALEADIHLPDGAFRRLKSAMLTASGADITMGLSIRRIEPDGTPKEPVADFGLSGCLRRNPRLQLVSRPLRAFRWKLSGEVDNTFIFKSLNFSYSDYGTSRR